MKSDEEYMRLAIDEAAKNLESNEGGPFGAVIVKNGEILAVAKNSVLITDATSHAEVNAIRQASVKINNFDLSGSIVYSTTEPCPMCFSALHWARVDKIVYGTSIADAQNAGFNELTISNKQMAEIGGSDIEIIPNCLRDDCLELFNKWSKKEDKQSY